MRKPYILKYDKAKGRPLRAGYELVKATKNAREAKEKARDTLNKYPNRYVSYDLRTDNKGYILVYMVRKD